MMTAPCRAEILADISGLLAARMGVDPSATIGEDTRFFADLGLASIDAVVLTEEIQQHYGRTLPFHDLIAEIGRRTDRDLSIGELVDFLETHLQAGQASRPDAADLSGWKA